MTIYSTTTLEFGTATRQLHFRKGSSDEAVIKQILVDQQYNLNRTGRVAELLAFASQQEASGRRPLVVDAGATIGVSSIYFTGVVPSALVVAVEPDNGNFELLCKNVEGLNVETIRGALASTPGHARLVDPGRGHWGYRTQPVAAGDNITDTVPRVTVDDIYESHRSTSFPFIVKADIEGAEGDLFSSNTEWVARTPLIIVELHDWLLPRGGTSRPFLQCISKLDRDFIYSGEDIYSVANDLEGLAAAR